MKNFFKKDQKTQNVLPKPTKPRSVNEIESNLDQISRDIGKLHHQKVCIEADITRRTNLMHQTILEYDQALKSEQEKSPDKVQEEVK